MQIGLRRRLFCEIGKTQNNLLRRRQWQNNETTLMAKGLLMSRLTYSVRSAVWNTRRPNCGRTAMRCSIHWEEISS